MVDVGRFISNSTDKLNRLNDLKDFLEEQRKAEEARRIEELKFVGYVLELGYDAAKIITSDPYKIAVGGIPRGKFLIMVPNNFNNIDIHFSLLRVKSVTTTPLTNQVQQTYFELHKNAMPELDVWTQSELQWGALECDVLGMFYPDPEKLEKIMFSGDVNNVVSAHRYKVFAPDNKLLDLIINEIVNKEMQYEIGDLRALECKLGLKNEEKLPVKISMKDFLGCRTAMFGKTRLGKSNVVKLIAKGIIESSMKEKNVGQIIFDINGEYANDNDQDGGISIRSLYEEQTLVYALTQRPKTPSKPLRLNFYEQPDSTIGIIRSFLEKDGKDSIYIKSFTNVELPSIESVLQKNAKDRDRDIRKIQMYWAILKVAGFESDHDRILALNLNGQNAKKFKPHFNMKFRKLIYEELLGKGEVPEHPSDINSMTREFISIAEAIQKDKENKVKEFQTDSGNDLLDPDDLALLGFIKPKSGAGPVILRPYLDFHSKDATDFISEVLESIDQGKTVILDLGNATDEIRRYFSDLLSKKVFVHQEKKFVTNSLNNNYVQLYFEEAHNLFPVNDKDFTGVYTRFAKEGAKFHIGMIYSTQSPSTVNKELLIQTENFFVGHLSSQEEAHALAKLQVAFNGVEEDILKSRTPGYMRMLTMSHRFIIPVQTKLFGK